MSTIRTDVQHPLDEAGRIRRDRSAPWNANRDELFFRLVQAAFPPSWLAGASVLLASYDDCPAETPQNFRLGRM